MIAPQWSPGIRRRAEAALSDLENFYEIMRAGSPSGRRQEMHRFAMARLGLLEAVGSDQFVTEKLAAIEIACKQLCLLQPLDESNESQTLIRGLHLVSTIRGRMHAMGLVETQDLRGG